MRLVYKLLIYFHLFRIHPKTHLFLKDRIVSPYVFRVKVPTPVDYDHSQWEGKEPNDEKDRLRIAAIEEAQHGQEQQQAKEDVQVPTEKDLKTYINK